MPRKLSRTTVCYKDYSVNGRLTQQIHLYVVWSTFCCCTRLRIPLYWSHCTVFPCSNVVVVPPAGNEIQLDSDWPAGVGDSGGRSSEATDKLRLTAGVTAGSLHAKVQRFFMILAFGHGSLGMHSSRSLANACSDRVCHERENKRCQHGLWIMSQCAIRIFSSFTLKCFTSQMGKQNIKFTSPGLLDMNFFVPCLQL